MEANQLIKVYVAVFHGDDVRDEVYRIFSTREKAEKYQKSFVESFRPDIDEWDVE